MRNNVILCDTDEFKFTGEVIDGNFYLHCDVKKTSHNVIKHIRDAFEIVKQQVYLEGWNFIFTYSTNAKWIKLFKGKLISTIQTENKEVGVYVWDLN